MDWGNIVSIGIPVAVNAALALPAAFRPRRYWEFVKAFILCALGIWLPLFTFVLSELLVPDWKGACVAGWLDCFFGGKLALSPLVLWAVVAFYVLEILQRKDAGAWMVYGLFLGAIVSTVCTVYGFCIIRWSRSTLVAWMLVPTYVSLWYGWRAGQLIRRRGYTFKKLTLPFLSSLPFWIASIMWSRKVFRELPDGPHPDCFVVTAASKGHRSLVGPFCVVKHRDAFREANAQLILFWELEACWRVARPSSHRVCRRIYNAIGPFIARQVRTPLIADTVYLLLKPLEIAARLLLWVKARRAQ